MASECIKFHKKVAVLVSNMTKDEYSHDESSKDKIAVYPAEKHVSRNSWGAR